MTFHLRLFAAAVGLYLTLVLFQAGIFTNRFFLDDTVDEDHSIVPVPVGGRRLPGGRTSQRFETFESAATRITTPERNVPTTKTETEEETAKAPCQVSTSADDNDLSTSLFIQQPSSNIPTISKQERVITLVHVGKAGGVTLREETSIICRTPEVKYADPNRVERCTRQALPQGNVLAHSVHHYFHVGYRNATELKESTSFLLPLRNPIDRLKSSYRFQHPENCNQNVYNEPGKGWPFGCQVVEQKLKSQYLLYYLCFPSGGMEQFAQSVMSPFPTLHRNNLTDAQQQYCRKTARRVAQGHYDKHATPHTYYNYEYYRNWTMLAYPEKEVFGVRTKEEWQDMKALDLAMGGNGVFRQEGKQVSHGSEHYVPSPLSTEAYHKLCCVLEREIDIYKDIVNRVLNFDPAIKEELMEEVRQKCGIDEWETWRRKCQQHLKEDEDDFRSWPTAREGRDEFKALVEGRPASLPPREKRDMPATKEVA